jgi:hypothetical protein
MFARWCKRILDDLTTVLTADQVDIASRQGAHLTIDAALGLASDVLNRDVSARASAGTVKA